MLLYLSSMSLVWLYEVYRPRPNLPLFAYAASSAIKANPRSFSLAMFLFVKVLLQRSSLFFASIFIGILLACCQKLKMGFLLKMSVCRLPKLGCWYANGRRTQMYLGIGSCPVFSSLQNNRQLGFLRLACIKYSVGEPQNGGGRLRGFSIRSFRKPFCPVFRPILQSENTLSRASTRRFLCSTRRCSFTPIKFFFVKMI